ncbi:MAG: biopolymer transporter ExbD [Bacteroidales bacterium]|nr:biopolymer transporter ExbD [Bacteroidales bacterium]
MARRMSQEINASSMADIAFLLLIFFLVTTTMDVDSGLLRVLPPPIDPNATPPPPIKERNVFVVLVNAQNQIMVEGQPGSIATLRQQTREFLLNPNNNPDLSEREMKTVENLGDLMVSKGVISLQNDRSTSYETYIAVQNELAAAINEIRNEVSREFLGKKFDELKDEYLIKAVRDAVPMAISEAEPKDITKRK